MNTYSELKKKINNKSAIVTVMGLGYVGLPIALAFFKKGFRTNGLDTNTRRIAKLRRGVSYINDVPSATIPRFHSRNSRFSVSADTSILSRSDIIFVCVPTPLRKVKEPNISFVIRAARDIRKYLRRGQLIVLESTTYPGTTREVILPVLEESGLAVEKDFYLAFSPERIDPGNRKYRFETIPKVVGGFGKKSTVLGKLVYSKVVRKVVPVSSPEAAEVTKLLENTFRIVNIALINEFANLCHRLGIDVWEIIKAAGTKPFGFMPFDPGPGIGGHCIPADPMYLSWKARTVGFKTKMIDLAAALNRSVPAYIVKRLGDMLRSRKGRIENARVLVVGVTYKRDVNDLRESPALDIIRILARKRAAWSYYDPYIPYLDIPGIKKKSVKLTKSLLQRQDAVVIVTDHERVPYEAIAENAKLVFDTRNALGKRGIKGAGIVNL